MNNEPVAWINLKKGGLVNFNAVWASKVKSKNPIPLYTHPVKELTNEEILEIGENCDNYWDNCDLIDFARAILRKAQEK